MNFPCLYEDFALSHKLYHRNILRENVIRLCRAGLIDVRCGIVERPCCHAAFVNLLRQQALGELRQLGIVQRIDVAFGDGCA